MNAAQYYKKYHGFREADRHDDAPLTWDSVISETEDFAKQQNAALTEENQKFRDALKEALDFMKRKPANTWQIFEKIESLLEESKPL